MTCDSLSIAHGPTCQLTAPVCVYAYMCVCVCGTHIRMYAHTCTHTNTHTHTQGKCDPTIEAGKSAHVPLKSVTCHHIPSQIPN